jgi:hypothetical protein
MPDFSLVPVDHQPDFEDVSLVPVDHNPFSADGVSPLAQAQPARTQSQPAQPQPESPPQQPATGVGQPNVNAPANSVGSGGPPNGGAAGGGPNPTSDQSRAERLPFSGYANPTPAESLVNQQKMEDQEEVIKADPTRRSGDISDGGDLYKFVTTKPTHRYLIDGGTGKAFTATDPFYAKEGPRHAFIDASPARPVTVTIKEDGTFTISRP